jgi:prevent-host-death family protein
VRPLINVDSLFHFSDKPSFIIVRAKVVASQYDDRMMTMSIVCQESRCMKTKTMPAGTFKSKCLTVVDQVQAKCEAVIITKHGKPVAKLVPVDAGPDDFYDFMKGKGEILGDVVGPAISEEEWQSD